MRSTVTVFLMAYAQSLNLEDVSKGGLFIMFLACLALSFMQDVKELSRK